MKRKTALIFVILSLIALSLFVSCTKKADDSLTPGPYPNPSYDKLEEDEEAEKENEPSEEAVELFEDYKHIAFTFDDGPDAILTKKFVDKLAEYGGRATFFVVGDMIDERTEGALKYAVSHGNEIGIHALTHRYDFSVCNDEVYQSEVKYTRNKIYSYAGVEPLLMRPPGGAITGERIANSKYPVILWSVDSEDWRHKAMETSEQAAKNVQIIVDNVLSSVKDGDILLMHEIYENSYKAFCVIIDTLYREGYRFVTVSELLGESIQSGVKYHCLTVN
ncbi:MAG: polysaccharide deacetylase family protein [Clostridia bacterium]|jgi:peptidoglycan/xylan/chitin deacetylase (PgdA/CDA1 family)|nr:polysaccharide deacetylase family protein [Clostridia bacterium]MBQ5800578.1 polysaccharide deacetylase family protein [Clostridia bacterium]